MPVSLPPQPRYPLALDDDSTLFHVYNTAQAPLSSDNAAWAEELDLVPSVEDLWADNGFASISGELFYYGGVRRNEDEQIIALTRCLRFIGGEKTRLNPAGTVVRGVVVAEHHNQLADALSAVERFLGHDGSEDPITIDYRIRQLEEEADCIDDHDCPTVKVDFTTVEDREDCMGTVATFDIAIEGQFDRIVVDFGDGNTTDLQSGEHVYAPGASIDPVVTVGNGKCEVVQTPAARDNPDEPRQNEAPEAFEIPIPQIPYIPDIIIPELTPPPDDFKFPPISFPCLSNGNLEIPTEISLTPPENIPVTIDFGDIDIPSEITVVSDIPSEITISGDVPAFEPVTFAAPPAFPEITFAAPPTIPIDYGEVPTVTIDWGTPPELTGTVNVVCGAPSAQARSSTRRLSTKPSAMRVEGEGIDGQLEAVFQALIDLDPKLLGVDSIQLEDRGDDSSTVEAAPIAQNGDFSEPLPQRIELIPVGLPTSIPLDTSSLEGRSVRIDASGVPDSIALDASSLPRTITLDASGIPSEIRVTGIPDFIELRGDIPNEIRLTNPDNIEIPVVVKEGTYIPIKLDMKSLGLPEGKTLADLFANPG